MTETTASEKPPDAADDAKSPAAPEKVASAPTPVGIWVLYGLGVISAAVVLGSLLVVAIEALGSGSGVDLHVSTAALVIWLALVVVAAGTFAWRRWGRPT